MSQVNPRSFDVDALLFDMDGTILTSIVAAERVWTRWAERHGLDAETFLPTIHGKRAIDTVRDAGLPDMDAETEAAAIADAEVEDVAGIEPIAGAGALLAVLPRNRWAIVTSAPRRLAERRIEAAGLPMPELLVTGDDVERGKPAPDAFALGARGLGVAPQRCLVFEDAAAGIQAAERVGAHIVVVSAMHAAATDSIHPTIADYHDVHAVRRDNGLRIQLPRPAR